MISYKRKATILAIIQKGTITPKNSRLERLTEAISKSSDGNDFGERILCPISLMKLSLGPWLGDIIVRDKSFNDALPKSASDKKQRVSSKKGFVRTPPEKLPSSLEKEDTSDGFAEWILGVQKAAITFKWDIGENISQSMNLGKCLGCGSEWPISSRGIIHSDDGMSRRIEPQERTLYIDYETGVYGGFIVGSAYLKAPRFFKLNNSSRSIGRRFSMLTELSVF